MGQLEKNDESTSAELVPVDRPPESEQERVTDLGALGLAGYSPPEGYKDFADKEQNGRRKILYLGANALVDIVDKGYTVGDVAIPDILLLRVEGPREQAMDVFNYPQRYAPEADARRVFGEAA